MVKYTPNRVRHTPGLLWVIWVVCWVCGWTHPVRWIWQPTGYAITLQLLFNDDKETEVECSNWWPVKPSGDKCSGILVSIDPSQSSMRALSKPSANNAKALHLVEVYIMFHNAGLALILTRQQQRHNNNNFKKSWITALKDISPNCLLWVILMRIPGKSLEDLYDTDSLSLMCCAK